LTGYDPDARASTMQARASRLGPCCLRRCMLDSCSAGRVVHHSRERLACW